VPEVLPGRRVVADPAAIDAIVWDEAVRLVRIAPDDVFAIGAGAVEVADPHAISEPETMFCGVRLDRAHAADWVAHHADWQLPPGDGLSQGMVAALPIKILCEGDDALVIVPVSFAAELEYRLPDGVRGGATGGRR
jgi:hypothetical protein